MWRVKKARLSTELLLHHIDGFFGNEVFHMASVLFRRCGRNAVKNKKFSDNTMLFIYLFGVILSRFGKV